MSATSCPCWDHPRPIITLPETFLGLQGRTTDGSIGPLHEDWYKKCPECAFALAMLLTNEIRICRTNAETTSGCARALLDLKHLERMKACVMSEWVIGTDKRPTSPTSRDLCEHHFEKTVHVEDCPCAPVKAPPKKVTLDD